jgi:hypothetical protein
MDRSISAPVVKKLLVYIFISSLLVACGGSGGGSSNPPNDQAPIQEDKTPDSFTFAPLTDVARDVQLVSETVTISGINTEIAVSISGGEYSIDGGEFTSTAGTINNNQTLQLRTQTPVGFAETKTVVISLSEFSAELELTTMSLDITPEAFVFNNKENVALNYWVESDVVTISGINDAVEVVASDLEYSIDGADFTSANGFISNGQTLQVRALSAAEFKVINQGRISIGTLAVPFTVGTPEAPQMTSLDLMPDSEIKAGKN